MRGAYYPRGGASEFAFHMIPVIQQSGGAVLVRAPVQRVLLNQQGKAYGEQMVAPPPGFGATAPSGQLGS